MPARLGGPEPHGIAYGLLMRYTKSWVVAGGLGVVFVAVSAAAWLMGVPAERLEPQAQALRSVLDMAVTVAAVLVVGSTWHVVAAAAAPVANALNLGFTIVLGCAVLRGVLPLAASAADDLRLVGGVAEAACLWAFPLRRGLAGGRGVWQLLGLVAVVLLGIVIGQGGMVWGSGDGGAKAGGHLALGLACVLVTTQLGPKAGNAWTRHVGGLAWACLLIGASEFVLGLHAAPAGVALSVAQSLKFLGYMLVVRTLYVVCMREPFKALEAAREALKDKEAVLASILTHVPAAVIQLNRDFQVTYANPRQAARLNRSAGEVVGASIHDLAFQPGYAALLAENTRKALGGEAVAVEADHVDERLGERHSHITFIPERSLSGDVHGIIAFTVDQTENVQNHRRLQASLRELSEITTALDAHAIVAVTDARGIITRVNDKFCEISRYDRGELVGRTHHVVNSGYHPPGFFRELWHTISAGGIWNGEICNRAKDGSIYWVHTTIVPYVGPEGIPYQYIAIRADITARKRAEQEAIKLAAYDVLTGLANRRVLIERLNLSRVDSVRSDQYCALLLVDLDGFKKVNDTFGHEFGDLLLQGVASRLTECVRQGDTVARMGGDEFVLLLVDLGNDLAMATSRVQHVGGKILRVLGRPYTLGGAEVLSAPSVGMVGYRGLDHSVEELLKRADIALYEAKTQGGARLCMFEAGLQARVEERSALETDLREAVTKGQLSLHYQPIVDKSRRIVGVEALVRWMHPRRGMVSPGVFIPIAEQTGAILSIGRWVLETACRQLARWRDDPVASGWSVAVNVSARQLYAKEFAADVMDVLERTGADPGRLRLELTEGLLLHDVVEAIGKMKELKACGVRFSLDDFGTGYSSLSYLKKLPLDLLKIDKSFVDDILSDRSNLAISTTILALARSLDIDVVAEGVETEAQYGFLRENGCRYFQGFLFGRPEPIEALPSTASRLAGVPIVFLT